MGLKRRAFEFIEDAFTDANLLSRKHTLAGAVARCEVTGALFTLTVWVSIVLAAFVLLIMACASVFSVPGYFIERDKERVGKARLEKEDAGYGGE